MYKFQDDRSFDKARSSDKRTSRIKAILMSIFLVLFGFALISSQLYKPNGYICSQDFQFGCKSVLEKLYRFYKTVHQNYPVKELSIEQIERFEINLLPIKYNWFVDSNYVDMISTSVQHVSQKDIEMIKQLVARKSPSYNSNNDLSLNEMLSKYVNSNRSETIRNRAAIFGLFNQQHVPWIEALLLLHRLNNISIYDFSPKTYESGVNVSWMHINDMLAKTSHLLIDNFDVIVSHYSIEQLGLGKFGEVLEPNADLAMLDTMHCWLAPGGLLFLTLSRNAETFDDEQSYVEFNTKRCYGSQRIEHIIYRHKKWILVDNMFFNYGQDQILVLLKNTY